MFIINTFPLPPTDFLMAPSFRNSFSNSSEKKAPAFTTRYKFSLFFKNCPSVVSPFRGNTNPQIYPGAFSRIHNRRKERREGGTPLKFISEDGSRAKES